MTSGLNAQNMINDTNTSLVYTIHKIYLICMSNKGSICGKSLDILRNTK